MKQMRCTEKLAKNQISLKTMHIGKQHQLMHQILLYLLNGRRILLFANGATHGMRMMSGVLQDSVLGPTLQNLFYDGLLRLWLPIGVSVVGFADDVTTEGLERATNGALELVSVWISQHGFELAHVKMEEVVLIAKSAYRQLMLCSGGVQILVMCTVKYFRLQVNFHPLYPGCISVGGGFGSSSRPPHA